MDKKVLFLSITMKIMDKNYNLMKNTILQQRQERDMLLSNQYQPRTVKVPLDDYLKSPLIKLITGPRRAGKSVFALLMLKNTNFAYLNFDDSKLLSLFNEDSIAEFLQEVYPDYKYLFLDEIQNLPKWELWVAKLYRRGVNLIITGSNSKLLSSEMATALTGRYLSIDIFPFSALEYATYRGVDITDNSLEKNQIAVKTIYEYVHNGGFAETILTPSILQTYLSGIYDSVLLKDIVKRYKIRNVSALSDIAAYLLSNFTNRISISNITKELGLSSKTSTNKFCNYLQQSFLYFFLPQYNNKLQIMKKADRKVYMVDNGFITAQAFTLSQNDGRLLENAVFIHLIQMGLKVEQNLFYYRTRNNKEVDFVIKNGNATKTLIQVCYDLSSDAVKKREVSALVEGAQDLKSNDLLIITLNDDSKLEYNGYNIKVVPFYKWVME